MSSNPKEKGTFLLQAFLNFSKYTAAKQDSLSRRATMSSFSSASGLANATNTSGNPAPIPALVTPEHPLILRLPDSCTAEQATTQTLQQFYLSKWVERVQAIVSQMAEHHGVKPSDQLTAELSTIGRNAAKSSKQQQNGPVVEAGGRRRLSSIDQKKERTSDDIIRTVLQYEERHFYENVLPSRFIEDYQIFISLCDGTLPNANQSGALTTSKPHTQQLQDMHENPKDWVVPPGSIVKQHPKATFPYSVAICYRPTKTSRTMNDIMSRSSSFVAGGSVNASMSMGASFMGTFDANVSQLMADRSVALGGGASGDPLKSAAQYLVAQGAPKNMLGDDTAKKRGFTILPFLPVLRGGSSETYVDPQIAKFLRRISDNGATKDSGAPGSVPVLGADDDDRDKEIDLTVDEIMSQAGLTLYDIARHGSGSLAHLGRDHVVEQVPIMARNDVERKRQENVIRAERSALSREEVAMRLAEKKELSMREEHTAKMAAARLLQQKTELDVAREDAARERAKEERRLNLARRIEGFKAAAQQELEDQQERQKVFLEKLEMTLHDKTTRRRLDTTLEGERTKAEELSRRAGPVSLRLNEFRPKVKQLDQQQRQENIFTSLVHSLETSLLHASQVYHTRTGDALAERHAYEHKVREEQVVRTADVDTLAKKSHVRNVHIDDVKRQEELVSRPEGEVSILRIAAKPSTTYFSATLEDEALRAEERNRNFLEWKERRRVEIEAKMLRKELGIKAPSVQ